MALTKADKLWITQEIHRVVEGILDAMQHSDEDRGQSGGYDGAIPYVDDAVESARRRRARLGSRPRVGFHAR